MIWLALWQAIEIMLMIKFSHTILTFFNIFIFIFFIKKYPWPWQTAYSRGSRMVPSTLMFSKADGRMKGRKRRKTIWKFSSLLLRWGWAKFINWSCQRRRLHEYKYFVWLWLIIDEFKKWEHIWGNWVHILAWKYQACHPFYKIFIIQGKGK